MKATLSQLSASLVKHHGNIGRVAEEFEMSFQGVHQRIQKTPKLQAVLAELDANTTTAARGVVMAAVAEGDVSTAKWFLEKRDPAFRPSANLKLDPETVRAMMAAATPDALRKMAAG